MTKELVVGEYCVYDYEGVVILTKIEKNKEYFGGIQAVDIFKVNKGAENPHIDIMTSPWEIAKVITSNGIDVLGVFKNKEEMFKEFGEYFI